MARAATHAADRASSFSQQAEFNEEASGYRKETLTEKSDAKQEAIVRRAVRDGNIQTRAAENDEGEEYETSNSDSDAEIDSHQDQAEEHSQASEYGSDDSDDPNAMSDEQWEFVYRRREESSDARSDIDEAGEAGNYETAPDPDNSDELIDMGDADNAEPEPENLDESDDTGDAQDGATSPAQEDSDDLSNTPTLKRQDLHPLQTHFKQPPTSRLLKR
ncbi:hypothetical protein N431DRAFT_458599 [Stipitochalara longipes BDJ]|nr:hypothetical protein N431DRAFT_458599 [Stipitochalara longipes BDJ]